MAIDNTDNELDDLVRVAMKTLDAQVPSGYFEGLPNRTLARLEDSSMQTTSGTSKTELPVADLPASQPVKERDEDSGLHDIRNLASSQRSRLSSRRLGTNPPPLEEDVLASTSGSWKSIALPEPAKMVSLPEIASLPSKADIKAAEKAEKAAAKARSIKASARPSGEIQPPADIAPSSSAPSLPVVAKVVDAPLTLDDQIPSIAPAAPAAPMIGSRIAGVKTAKPVTPITDAPKKKRGALIASLSVAVAAAAGAVIYVSIDKKNADTAPALGAERALDEAKPAIAAPTAQAIATDNKDSAAEPAEGSGAVAADPVPAVEPPTPTPAKLAPPVTKGKKPGKPGKKVIEVDDPGNGVGKKPTPPTKPVKEPSKEGDPDFDQLIKDSGYTKKVDKPKLDKKVLNGTDFKKGIGAIQGKAMGCYNGTQGTAMVKIFIAPSGSVTNVVVSGTFANTPVAACIVGAIKSASFPAWDGPPASYNYSYLLSN